MSQTKSEQCDKMTEWHSKNPEWKSAEPTPEVKSKRRLFGLGRKKKKNTGMEVPVPSNHVSSSSHSSSSISSPRARATHPYQQQSSPNPGLYSSSPRIISPARSQIFERDVQESLDIPVPNSPAIPSHIQNENRIPPVLDASSEAITNSHLDPEQVEIVTHTAHHGVASNSEATTGSLWSDDSLAHPEKEELTSNYGSLDSADVRRLSFISFADVVQSEHAEHSENRDSIHVTGLTPLMDRVNRSPSPVRSPMSSACFGPSSPTSRSTSPKTVESSPHRIGRPLGGAAVTYPCPPELTIETMGQAMQALKRTGSSDLNARGLPQLSPISNREATSR